MFDEESEATFDLASRLTDDQWTVPSLCPGWTIRDVVVHVGYHTHRSGLKETLPNLDKTSAMMVKRESASTRDGLLRWLNSPPAPAERKCGLRMVATDLDWTSGKGPEVRGTAEAMLMVIAGRRMVISDLDGDGVRIIDHRLRAQPGSAGDA